MIDSMEAFNPGLPEETGEHLPALVLAKTVLDVLGQKTAALKHIALCPPCQRVLPTLDWFDPGPADTTGAHPKVFIVATDKNSWEMRTAARFHSITCAGCLARIQRAYKTLGIVP